jgi:hypothetical protein
MFFGNSPAEVNGIWVQQTLLAESMLKAIMTTFE